MQESKGQDSCCSLGSLIVEQYSILYIHTHTHTHTYSTTSLSIHFLTDTYVVSVSMFWLL